ncbi:NUDIX hydrolase [Streptomyces litchfieldiae]|uniref:NUDIX hydrolase n=1 Tax=Streptomyces litchfieldiae TaxID=3075543 RepID=A0ABU2MPM0_9ACTN|nr:NUDIX hydrolase [Streptomyces sp. DSM 44938]MDT0343347.1 NUDIX hydrolase [Streptomyces sp. DSM 44938]
MADAGPIRAAGCVLWRRAADVAGGGIEVALVHRPKYDDWSHPKGKLDAGEAPADAARREVREETGVECWLGPSLTTARYLARGRPKEVVYWVAEAVGGHFVPSREVDEVRWLPPAHARAQLSHPGNRALLDEALALLSPGTGGGPPPPTGR